MNASSRHLSRREFMVATASVAGGFALSVLPRSGAMAKSPGQSPEINPWIVIAADDTITIRMAAPEAGTGNTTQAALYVAEELQCDWQKIRIEPLSFARDAREDHVYIGSSGTWSTFAGGGTQPEVMQTMLQAGASVRERLRVAAASSWRVPLDEVTARDGLLTHAATQRQAGYGELAAAASSVELPQEPQLKRREEWTVLRKQNPARLHLRSVVDGTSVYGIDIRLPGMLYAALLQCPVHGGKLKSFDFDAVRNLPGIRGYAVVDPAEPRKKVDRPADWALTEPSSAIAIVAEHYWQARQALEALPVEWDFGEGAQWKNTQQVYDTVLKRLDAPADEQVIQSGNAQAFDDVDGDLIEATYFAPFSEHATMEPLNGTALVTHDRVELWHPFAMVLQALAITTEETGVGPENIHVHLPLVGGSFGRRVGCDDLRMVLAVAKKFTGTPIHVIWSREETFRQGKYRDLQAARLRARFDAEGLPQSLHVHVAAHSPLLLGLENTAYTNGCVPDVRIEKSTVAMHILTGQYRGPGYNTLCFFLESFIDECATRSGIDPLEYRLRLAAKWPDPGWTKCLNEVAARAEWGRKLPKGHGQGIAVANWGMQGKPHEGTTVAVIATVEVDASGAFIVHEIDLAFDCGQMVNEDSVRAQLEGGLLFGLNMCLNEELHIEDGRIVEGNFDQYRMIRMADVPRTIRIHTGAVSGHARYSGVGEVSVGILAPAIANAIFAATGKRIRSMPFRSTTNPGVSRT
jgi:isoquinoline 1-oxidoreductase beta subunit